MQDYKEAEEALTKAKLRLMLDPKSVFFSSLCCGVTHTISNQVPTAGTTGLAIYYNPEFLLSLSPAERTGLLLHEVLHIAFQHVQRKGERDIALFNKAADYAINLIIIDAGFTLPEGGLLDEQYRGLGAEEIYELLDKDDSDEEAAPWEDLLPGSPDEEDGEDNGNSGQQQEAVQEAIDNLLVQAAQATEAAGVDLATIPESLREHIIRLTNPEVPWYRILRGFMNRLAKTEYSFKRPNRRYLDQDIIMPSYWGEALELGCISVDTSGSIGEGEFDRFITETSGIVKQLQPKELKVMQWDTKIRNICTVDCIGDVKNLKPHGGGGTNPEPALQWAKKHKPNWFLIFSDGEFWEVPKCNPKVPVIWVIYDNPTFTAPFGKVIHCKL